MKLHVSGVKVPRLGSVEDRVIRQYLTKEAQKETKKAQLLALIAINSAQTTDQNEASEWLNKVRKIFNVYLGLEYGVEIPEQTEIEVKMSNYYEKVVKKMKLKLSKDGTGQLVVSGLQPSDKK